MAQQGNGTTTVNKKPTLVHGFENTKIARVACGSSHSVAWTMPESSLRSTNDTVLFADVRDPLGIHSLGFTDTLQDETASFAVSLIDPSGGCESPDGSTSETSLDQNQTSKPRLPKQALGRPSLTKIILSMSSVSAQQNSLLQLLNALQIMYARMAVVAALSSPSLGRTSASRRSSKSKIYWDSSIYGDSAGSLHSYSSPLRSITGSALIKEELIEGGGEAPADGTLENLVKSIFDCSILVSSFQMMATPCRMKLWRRIRTWRAALLACLLEKVCPQEPRRKLAAISASLLLWRALRMRAW